MRWQGLIAVGLCVLAVLTLTELVVDVTILGDVQPLLFGALLATYWAPQARSAARFDRVLARVGIVGGLLLVVGALGDLLT